MSEIREFEAHPEFAAGIATWLTIGIVLFILGLLLFLYSEIQAVLVVRDQDFRAKLVSLNFMTEGKNIDELNQEENATMLQFLLPTGNPILLLLWLAVTFGGGAAYFWFVPDHYQKNPLKDSANGKPSWLQDIGDFSISTEGNDIVNAIHDKMESESKRFKKEKV
eukprot:691858-Hanusia_phi.AAC.6